MELYGCEGKLVTLKSAFYCTRTYATTSVQCTSLQGDIYVPTIISCIACRFTSVETIHMARSLSWRCLTFESQKKSNFVPRARFSVRWSVPGTRTRASTYFLSTRRVLSFVWQPISIAVKRPEIRESWTFKSPGTGQSLGSLVQTKEERSRGRNWQKSFAPNKQIAYIRRIFVNLYS